MEGGEEGRQREWAAHPCSASKMVGAPPGTISDHRAAAAAAAAAFSSPSFLCPSPHQTN